MKLLDYKEYLLHNNQSVTQPQLNFVKQNQHKDATSKSSLNVCNTSESHSSKSALTAKDPEFISEFYNNSRLHLIATLGAEFKQLVSTLREKSQGKFPGLDELKKFDDISGMLTFLFVIATVNC